MIGLFRLYLTVILKDLVNVFQFWMVRKEVDFMKKVLYFLPEMKRLRRKDFTQKNNYKYINIFNVRIISHMSYAEKTIRSKQNWPTASVWSGTIGMSVQRKRRKDL